MLSFSLKLFNSREELFIMIIWLTGQPGSGKTTLANQLIKSLTQNNKNIKILNIDGDDLRALNKNKDYSKKGRIKIFQLQYQLFVF